MLGAVALGFVVLEGAGNDVRGLDRVQPGLHVAHMGGAAADCHPGPYDADFGCPHRVHAGARFGNDGGVAGRQREQAGGGAIAGAFLLDDGVQLHRRRGRQASQSQRGEGRKIGRDAALHVSGAAAEDATVANHRGEGRAGPHIRGTLRHHVDMTLKDQRTAADRARLIQRHDIIAAFIAHQRGREDRIVGRHHRDAARRQAKRLELPRHFSDRAGLVAQRAGVAHQAGDGFQRAVAQRVAGVEDGTAGAGVEMHGGSMAIRRADTSLTPNFAADPTSQQELHQERLLALAASRSWPEVCGDRKKLAGLRVSFSHSLRA